MKGGYVAFSKKKKWYIPIKEGKFSHDTSSREYKYSLAERNALMLLIPNTYIHLETFWTNFNVEDYKLSMLHLGLLHDALIEACKEREIVGFEKTGKVISELRDTDYRNNDDLSEDDKNHVAYYILLKNAEKQVKNFIEKTKQESITKQGVSKSKQGVSKQGVSKIQGFSKFRELEEAAAAEEEEEAAAAVARLCCC